MDATLTLRKASAPDHAFIVESQIQMAAESEALVLSCEIVTRGVQKILQGDEPGFYLLAERAGEPVGVMLVLQEWSDWRNAWVYWIHSLFVVSSARRQGVFRRMYAHLKSEVIASDQIKGLRLYVDKSNVTAQKTYLAVGMSRDHYELFEWLK